MMRVSERQALEIDSARLKLFPFYLGNGNHPGLKIVVYIL